MAARIFQRVKSSTQSGRAHTRQWTLEHERSDPQRADPLTGWPGSRDTKTQVKLSFDSLEAAKAYAQREGIDVHVVPAPQPKLKLQTYADNFR